MSRGNVNVGIRFADNDFWWPVCRFLGSLQQHFKHDRNKCNQSPDILKRRIVRLYNDTILAHYLMDITDDALYQSIKDRENETHKYLKIDECNVYINDEIGEYLTKCGGWDNSEFHYFYGLDGDIQTI